MKYYMLRWETEKYGMPNNYVSGYEVFTTKKAANEYVKLLKKEKIKVGQVNEIKSYKLSAIVNGFEYGKVVKYDYGYVENRGFAFH